MFVLRRPPGLNTFDSTSVQSSIPVGLNCLKQNARDCFVHDKESQELVKISCIKEDLKTTTTHEYYHFHFTFISEVDAATTVAKKKKKINLEGHHLTMIFSTDMFP